MSERKSSWTPSDVDEAIENSGYPLQLRVAAMLESAFEITEEWGYVDRTTGELRTLDLHAFRRMTASDGGAIRPGLALLIEQTIGAAVRVLQECGAAAIHAFPAN